MSAREAGAPAPLLEAVDVRFGQVGIANLRMHSLDPDTVRASIEARVHEAPALLTRAPAVVDLSFLSPTPDDGAVRALLDAVRAAGMLPAGLAYGDDATAALAARLGLPLISRFRAAYERAGRQPAPAAPPSHADASAPAPAAPPPEPAAPEPATTLQHLLPVRSGQQVYAQGRDLIVVGTVANGAEVLADGNIHVYGALRGRAFAGAAGDRGARIFCSEFRPEIVSIAGQYRVFEELPAEFAGRAVQIALAHDRLQITPL